jgi:DUF971 family protein
MPGESDSTVRPHEIDLQRTRRLRVVWGDGHESVYPLALLRKACPCATCRDQREKAAARPRGALPILSGPTRADEMAVVETAELVGHYAIRFAWKDGHETGIYDFRLLRGLCPCEACAKTRGAAPEMRASEPKP